MASVQYTGNTSAAVVTTANASRLVANVFGSDTATINSSLADVSTQGIAPQGGNGGLTALTQRLNGSFRETLVRTSMGSAERQLHAGASIDETELCDSGSIRTTGTVNDANGTGTLTLTFNDCRTGDATLAGQATVRVDAFDFGSSLPTDFTASFGRLTLRGPAISIDAGGSTRAQLNIAGNTETITENLVSLDNLTGRMTKAENLVLVNSYNDILTPSTYSTSPQGRIFDSELGFVDVAMVTPSVFGTLIQLFPQSGQTSLTGSGSSKISFTALSATLAKLELDLDGNGGFENTATLKWTDLSGPVGSDLGDTDRDGMHNSWETANGLNPNVDDADDDKDTDNVKNIDEYLLGTDPNHQ
jgi:hypothetical protein